MRRKAFYSEQEIVKNLYTQGKEWMLTDYTEYKGQYHRYTTGEVYTQPDWNKLTSKRLIKYQDLTETVKIYKSTKNVSVEYNNNIPSYKPVTTVTDKKTGSITRYFIKRYDSELVTEISVDTFNKWSSNKIDKNIYQATSIEWIVADTYTKIDSNKDAIPQVAEFNRTTVLSLQRPFAVLSKYLTDYTELYVDTTYTIPPDINNI
jgi:hypothetical protein